ncbi:MAG: SIMPL domain-containing protein [Candidatus Eremiobacteraeota bacterium]|nr:SIMPL domain-containing protein [Candidatus Eremiobacteraeota bacterium]
MRRLLMFLAFVSALAPLAALAQTDAGSAQPSLVVQGQGIVSRAPDVASLSVGIETVDPSATQSQARNNAIYARLLTALERVNVPRSSVQFSGYDLRYVPPSESTPEPIPMATAAAPGQRQTLPVARNPRPAERWGYVVSRNVTIVDLNPSRVGQVVDAASGAGATSVDGVTFGMRDRRGVYNAALAGALDDADAQARALAAAGHFRLVRLQRIEVGSVFVPGPVPMARMAVADGTQISPSNVETRANVTVTYTIAAGG